MYCDASWDLIEVNKDVSKIMSQISEMSEASMGTVTKIEWNKKDKNGRWEITPFVLENKDGEILHTDK